MMGWDTGSARRQCGLMASVVALSIGLAPLRAGAQEVGDRVRVALPDRTVAGKVLSVDAASLELSLAGGGVLSANRSEVFRLERSLPRHWVWLGGAGLGFAAGCSVGICLDEDSWGDAFAWKIAGAGAVAGLAVTALSGVEVWNGIPLPDMPEGPIVGDRVRVALADMTIEGDVTSVSRHGFAVAGEDGGVQSVERSQVLLLEQRVSARRLWLEGLAAGFALSGIYFVGTHVSQWDEAIGCAFTLGYAKAQCDELGLGDEELLLLAALPVAGLIIGATRRVEAWKSVQPRIPGGGAAPVIDLGVDVSGRPVVLLGGRFRF